MGFADKEHSFILTGNGDCVEPEDNIAAIGSGGLFALSAARALMLGGDKSLSAKDVAEKSMKIAADICVFSNHNIIFEAMFYYVSIRSLFFMAQNFL